VRSACDIIAQLLSSQLAATDHRAEADSRILLKSNQTRLLAYMAEEEDFLDGPRRHPEALLACANADGAAILYKDECHLFGTTPPDAVVRDLARWIEGRIGPNDVFHTDSLPSLYPPGESFSAQACGVIAASISSLHNSYVMWFRPELQRTVKWGGDPRKPGGVGEDQRLSPRNSFDLWKETVRFRSRPWTEGEVSSAAELRQAIVRIVLRRAEELAQLTEELQRSNQELEAFSYSVSHDLRAPFRHIVGFAELLLERESSEMSETGKRYIRTIVESAHFAGTLVDNLLSFSQIGRATIHPTEVDTAKLVAEVLKTAEENGDTAGRQIEWRVEELPSVCADLFMLRLVFQNLVSNAIKYTRPREVAVIEIKARREAGTTVFQVNDNGVGFDPQYAGKLFGIFQRLHKMEDFEGTGIGLANVRRIVTRHGGRTWAEGTPDRGASFYFSIPDTQ
jgi:light-regulated signal transduction histidine kinase (bacteriophytochrome)